MTVPPWLCLGTVDPAALLAALGGQSPPTTPAGSRPGSANPAFADYMARRHGALGPTAGRPFARIRLPVARPAAMETDLLLDGRSAYSRRR